MTIMSHEVGIRFANAKAAEVPRNMLQSKAV